MLSLYYLFVVTAGTYQVSSWHTAYYYKLAEGFWAGHLYLPDQPNPRLLQQANPYSLAHKKFWLWDTSLYAGHYYLNWGPVPALWICLFTALTGSSAVIDDQWLVLWFMLLRMYFGTALIVTYARRQVPSLPSWALQLSIVMFAVASPTPYVMARPMMYEASISSGQASVFAGLYFAYLGLSDLRRRLRWYVWAGVCLSLAFASRATMFPVCALVCVVTLLSSVPAPHRNIARFVSTACALCAAPLLSCIAYGAYNYLRFDDPFEFGLSYLLSSPPFTTNKDWIIPNIVSYLLSELGWSCQFPFVDLPVHHKLTSWITWPRSYNTGSYELGERTAGILLTTSICWLWVVWLGRGVCALVKRAALRRSCSWSTSERWLVGCSIALICGLAPAARMWMATMRFLEDACGGVLLGAFAAGFWMITRPQRTPLRNLSKVTYLGLGLYSVFVGICLGFTGPYNNFIHRNPELFQWLVHKLSVCR